MEYNQHQTLVAHASMEEQTAFYRKTYGNVAIGVLVFILLEAFMLNNPTIVNLMLSFTGNSWMVVLLAFMGVTWLAQNITYKSADPMRQYAGYFLFILAEALIFVPILYIAMNFVGGPKIIVQAGVITVGMFMGLTAVVMQTKIDFSFMRSIITIGFFIAMGLIVAGLLFGFDLGLWFSAGMVLLASGSIIYSTYQIKNEFATDQYVPAALSLFASLMLLFWYVLRIFMSRD